MIDLSFRAFLTFAERLNEHAVNAPNETAALPFLTGTILTSWVALEAFVNSMMNDYAAMPGNVFTIHEKGFLEERPVRMCTNGDQAGHFVMESGTEYRRLEDKILFLLAKVGRRTINKGSPLWQRFEKAKRRRNELTHWRRNSSAPIMANDAQEALDLSRELIEFLSKQVWKKAIKW